MTLKSILKIDNSMIKEIKKQNFLLTKEEHV